MPEQPLSIANAAAKLTKPFTHTVLGQVDNYCAYLSRFQGSYMQHQHARDEMYVILEGAVDIDYDDGSTVHLLEGDSLVVRADQVHRSRSEGGALVLMFKALDLFAE